MITHDSNAERQVPIVFGEVVTLPADVDETYGLPAEAAARVSGQVLQALADFSIDPNDVVFSGV